MPRRIMSGLRLPKQAVPSAPPAGMVDLVVGNDGRLHRSEGGRVVALADAEDNTDRSSRVVADAGHVVWQGLGTATTQTDRNVIVTAGSVCHGASGASRAVPGQTLAIAAAHATLPRRDLIVVTSTGALTVRPGDPAAVPVKPTFQQGDIALWEISVPAGSTVVVGTDLVDKRVVRPPASGQVLARRGDNVYVERLWPGGDFNFVEISSNLRPAFVGPPSGRIRATMAGTAKYQPGGWSHYWSVDNDQGGFANKRVLGGSSVANPDVEITSSSSWSALSASMELIVTPGLAYVAKWMFCGNGGGHAYVTWNQYFEISAL